MHALLSQAKDGLRAGALVLGNDVIDATRGGGVIARFGARAWTHSAVRAAGGETNVGARRMGVDEAVGCAGHR